MSRLPFRFPIIILNIPMPFILRPTGFPLPLYNDGEAVGRIYERVGTPPGDLSHEFGDCTTQSIGADARTSLALSQSK
jgi:hypothetical protein